METIALYPVLWTVWVKCVTSQMELVATVQTDGQGVIATFVSTEVMTFFLCNLRNCSFNIPFQGHCSTLIKYVHFLACPTGTYGRDCASVCKGYCKGGCNHVTGKCDSGCEPGWDIENCNVGMSKSCIKFSSHFKFTRFVRIIISHYKLKGS